MASRIPVPDEEETERFRRIVADETGEELTHEEAAELASEIVALVYLIDDNPFRKNRTK